VKLKLYKGNCINAGVKSPNSLYMEEIATFGRKRARRPSDERVYTIGGSTPEFSAGLAGHHSYHIYTNEAVAAELCGVL